MKLIKFGMLVLLTICLSVSGIILIRHAQTNDTTLPVGAMRVDKGIIESPAIYSIHKSYLNLVSYVDATGLNIELPSFEQFYVC